MRTVEIRCDNCGRPRPLDKRAKTWWVMEDQGEVIRTGALDFCSLACVQRFTADPKVQEIYALDYPKAQTVVTNGL